MKTFLSLGSNLGNKKENIDLAILKISHSVGEVLQQSSDYYTQPVGFESDNDFINAVVLVETELEPLELLEALQQIEQAMGRKHKSSDGAYKDRIIDIDILLYDDLTLDLPELKIPHPRMKERDFVMKPMQEILGLI